MATVSTRKLNKKDTRDVAAISVPAKDYEEKWGVLKVTLTGYEWGGEYDPDEGSFGRVTIGPPNLDARHDFAMVDKEELTTKSGDNAVGKDYFFAVNNGLVGPAARANEDGTWDLLHLVYEIKPNQNVYDESDEGIAVTATYSITFTDLTP